MKHTTRLSTKGQVVLPKSIRAARRWKPGTEFIVQENDKGVLLTPKASQGSVTWKSLVGCAGYTGRRKSIKEMDEAVTAEARRHK